jgi:hypothetical protein
MSGQRRRHLDNGGIDGTVGRAEADVHLAVGFFCMGMYVSDDLCTDEKVSGLGVPGVYLNLPA